MMISWEEWNEDRTVSYLVFYPETIEELQELLKTAKAIPEASKIEVKLDD